MIYLFLFIYMILFPITVIVMLYKILDRLEKDNNIPIQTIQRKTHPNIATTSYESPLVGRSIQSYEKYKNRDGLYEPIKPQNGVEIKRED